MADGSLAPINLDALAAPFPDSAISWRVGSTNIDRQTGKPRGDKPASGIALAYIDARDVQNRLDTVCGVANWSDKYVETEKGRIICTLAIRIDGEWIAKSDGAGDSDVESEKGAISDALKRAAVKWGIGRYLYDMESPWVALEQRGNSWVMKPSERKKLDDIHSNYVRTHFKNAAPSDAGQREQPKGQQATGAVKPPEAAPVKPMSKADARADYAAMDHELRACNSLDELVEWHKLNVQRMELQPRDWQPEIRKRYAELVHDFAKLELDVFLKNIADAKTPAALKEIGQTLVSATINWPEDLVGVVRDAYSKRLAVLKPKKEIA